MLGEGQCPFLWSPQHSPLGDRTFFTALASTARSLEQFCVAS